MISTRSLEWAEWWSQKDMSTSKSREPMNVTLFRKRASAGAIKNPETRLSWITQMGPECNAKRPCETQKRTNSEGRAW